MAIDPKNLSGTANLTFSDEFNSLSLWNGTGGTWSTNYWYNDKWNLTTSKGGTLAGNGEQQWYINANYAPTASVKPWTVSNGVLTLKAAPASADIQAQINGYKYTSGEINSYWSFSQQYGYFEMKAQLPAGQGLWPAFWMLPKDGSWPPELDIFEVLGHDMTTLHNAVHTNQTGKHTSVGAATKVPDMSKGYHTYGMDWQADYITFYFDGAPVYKTATPSDMHKPFYIQANLAVGGYWPGSPNSTTPFPAEFKIDYIRAYSAKPEGEAKPAPTEPKPSEPKPTTPSTGSPALFTLPTSGAGIDNVTTSAATYTAAAGIENVTLTGSRQTVNGNDLNNIITSNNKINKLNGGAGNDILISGRDGDTMTGGAGNDIFTFKDVPWNGTKITDFTRGQDIIDLRGMVSKFGYKGSDPIADKWLKIDADASGSARIWFDPDGAGSAHGWMLTTTVAGVKPADLRAGVDWVAVNGQASAPTSPTSPSPTSPTKASLYTLPTSGTGVDNVTTSAATYTAAAGIENVTLTGSRQTVNGNDLNNIITSNNKINKLNGGNGNDILISGRDGDTMTGGAGNDIFTFKDVPWNGTKITDFKDGQDLIDLRGMVSKFGYKGSDPIADKWMKLDNDAGGNARIWFDPDGPGAAHNPYLVTTVLGVSASSLHAQEDWYFA